MAIKATKTKQKQVEKQLKEDIAAKRRKTREQQARIRKDAALEKVAAKGHLKDTKKASQQLQEALQASVKKQKRRQAALISQNVTSDDSNIEYALEVPEQPTLARSRVRRRPAYLANFEVDY